MEIIRKRLEVASIYPANVRYDEATDEVQYSPDGGATWVESPENDPRQTNHYPPVATLNPACDAAERMTAQIQEYEAELEAGLLSASFGAEVATAILLALAFVPLIGVVTAAIIGLYAQLVPLGYAAVHAEFDGFNWAGFKCLVLKYVNADGRLTAEALASLIAEITAAYSTNQAFVLNGILSTTGFGVLNDAAAVRSEDGSCDTCSITWREPFGATPQSWCEWGAGFDVFGYRSGGRYASGAYPDGNSDTHSADGTGNWIGTASANGVDEQSCSVKIDLGREYDLSTVRFDARYAGGGGHLWSMSLRDADGAVVFNSGTISASGFTGWFHNLGYQFAPCKLGVRFIYINVTSVRATKVQLDNIVICTCDHACTT